MSKTLEPKKEDKIQKSFEPDEKKGNSSFNAPAKPQSPQPPPPKPKKS